MDLPKLLHGFVIIDTWISLSCYLDLSKLMHGFLKKFTWTCQNWYMDFSTLFPGFFKIDRWIFLCCQMDSSKLLHTWICLSCYMDLSKFTSCIFRPLLNKTNLKCDQFFKACLRVCFELKVLNEAKYSMPWVRFVPLAKFKENF